MWRLAGLTNQALAERVQTFQSSGLANSDARPHRQIFPQRESSIFRLPRGRKLSRKRYIRYGNDDRMGLWRIFVATALCSLVNWESGGLSTAYLKDRKDRDQATKIVTDTQCRRYPAQRADHKSIPPKASIDQLEGLLGSKPGLWMGICCIPPLGDLCSLGE